MPAIHFFATRADLLRMLAEVELRVRVAYARSGGYSAPSYDRVTTGRALPDLGLADADAANACAAFLVSAPIESPPVWSDSTRASGQPAWPDLQFRTIETAAGIHYLLDQRTNADTIVLTPAGTRMGVLLHGSIATATSSVMTRRLMNLFGNCLRRTARKVGAYRVGQEALWLGARGMRLTTSLQAPLEHDLIRQLGERPES